MRRCIATVAALALLSLIAGRVSAQPPGPSGLIAAHGEVKNVSREMLTIRPRDDSGRFGKDLELKLTGTSRISVVTVQDRAGKPAFVQQDTSPSDLKPGQVVAVIYASGPAGQVLLTAVARPAAGR
jgi:hypothetical protein